MSHAEAERRLGLHIQGAKLLPRMHSARATPGWIGHGYTASVAFSAKKGLSFRSSHLFQLIQPVATVGWSVPTPHGRDHYLLPNYTLLAYILCVD